jgi:hypothetical protein
MSKTFNIPELAQRLIARQQMEEALAKENKA